MLMPHPADTANNQKVLSIWVVSDGKPGHENQSIGLVQALEKHRKIELQTTAPLKHRDSMLALLTSRPPAAWNSHSKPDVIIGAGSGTQLTLIAARKLFQCFSVVLCGPSFPEQLFDLCVIPEHDGRKPRKNNIFTQGVLNKITPSSQPNPKYGLMLIGGESKHYQWDNQQVLEQIQQITALAPDIEWHLTNSRRTPEELNNALSDNPGRITFHPWESTDKNWLPKQIDQAGQIWATPDSVSMVYEALTSGNPTYAFNLTSLDTRVSKSIEKLRGNLLGHIKNGQIKQPSSPTKLWEANRIAKHLLNQLERRQS